MTLPALLANHARSARRERLPTSAWIHLLFELLSTSSRFKKPRAQTSCGAVSRLVWRRQRLLTADGLRTEKEVEMALLWALVLLLVIFAIVGGAAFSYWLFLLLVVAVILALAGAF